MIGSARWAVLLAPLLALSGGLACDDVCLENLPCEGGSSVQLRADSGLVPSAPLSASVSANGMTLVVDCTDASDPSTCTSATADVLVSEGAFAVQTDDLRLSIVYHFESHVVLSAIDLAFVDGFLAAELTPDQAHFVVTLGDDVLVDQTIEGEGEGDGVSAHDLALDDCNRRCTNRSETLHVE